MMKMKCLVVFLVGLVVSACGPDTIFVRPGLDTPEQHVAAGHQLLGRGKVEDAYREFSRAKELNPHFIKAYVGIGVALAYKGDIEAGLASMDRAKQMAGNPQELSEVRKGYERIDEIKHNRVGPLPVAR